MVVQNGQRDGTYFAVPYTENDLEEPFYVDWIVKFKSGRIGQFDTKEGIKYIREENAKGKNLFGGIVIRKDHSWRVNENAVYRYNENDLTPI